MSSRGNIKLHGHEGVEEQLFAYRRLIHWLREMDVRKFNELETVRMTAFNFG
jgi:hypothetical protein